ncbi:thiamine phosphate synthase [Ectothiorhodospiraceae bacterium WFHF3C12]|nr:thiamine phosphate synthase [Ectothiorhodospiraceae bacterium WFHF3C12]
MAIRSDIRGLYAITDPALQAAGQLPARVERALAGGARVIQYRDKSGDRVRRSQEAAALRRLCDQHDAVFIVNDDIELAAACGADGVHLGRDDTELRQARRRLGRDALIGVSCYNEMHRAETLAEAGADYLAFGSLFTSSTKPGAVHAPLSLIRAARRRFPTLPIVGIGGVDAGNAAEAVDAGVDALAVIRAVFAMPDPAVAAAAIAAAFGGRD